MEYENELQLPLKKYICFVVDICEKGLHFCSDIYRRCELCSDYPQDCFTEYHHNNCTNYCKDLLVKSPTDISQKESDPAGIPVWALVVVVAVLLLSFMLVLCWIKRKHLRCVLPNSICPMVHKSNNNTPHREIPYGKRLLVAQNRQAADGGIEEIVTEHRDKSNSGDEQYSTVYISEGTNINQAVPNPHILSGVTKSNSTSENTTTQVEADIDMFRASGCKYNEIADANVGESSAEQRKGEIENQEEHDPLLDHASNNIDTCNETDQRIANRQTIRSLKTHRNAPIKSNVQPRPELSSTHRSSEHDHAAMGYQPSSDTGYETEMQATEDQHQTNLKTVPKDRSQN